MLARRLTTVVPAMRLAEALETTRLPRVAGRTGDRTALVTTPWSRVADHHNSDVGGIGNRLVTHPINRSWQQACYPRP